MGAKQELYKKDFGETNTRDFRWRNTFYSRLNGTLLCKSKHDDNSDMYIAI